MKGVSYLLFIIIFVSAIPAYANAQIDLSQVKVYDTPNDGGGSITIEISEEDYEIKAGLAIFRISELDTAWIKIADYSNAVKKHVDDGLENGIEYTYGIALGFGAKEPTSVLSPTIPRIQFFNIERMPVLIGTVICIIIFFIVTYLIRKKGPGMIRKVAGLAAVDEAIGRATEMGRSILFVPGIQDLDDIQTIAGLSILNRVATITAEYDTPLLVPILYPLP